MTQHRGKGVAFSINPGGTTTINTFKISLTATPPVAVPVFKPLKNYVLPRAEEREAFRSIPSWKPGA